MVQDVTLLQSLVRRWAAIRACDRIRQERKQGSSAVRVQCWVSQTLSQLFLDVLYSHASSACVSRYVVCGHKER